MKKMLVVEDDELSKKTMSKIFKNVMEIDFCQSVGEFTTKFSESNYDIILLDITLSGIKQNLELAKEIKQHPKHISTPIICLTTQQQTKLRQTAINSGTDLFLIKPVPNQVLREAVFSLIK